jgi:Cdc6-like AAA superfamily ATPase
MTGMVVLFIDEIDALAKGRSKSSVLEQLFSWTRRPFSKLIVLGIANSMDLTQKMDTNGLITSIFKPYSQQDISDILTNKLSAAEKEADASYFSSLNKKSNTNNSNSSNNIGSSVASQSTPNTNNTYTSNPVTGERKGINADIDNNSWTRYLPLFHSSAIELCSKKIASSGDLRSVPLVN